MKRLTIDQITVLTVLATIALLLAFYAAAEYSLQGSLA